MLLVAMQGQGAVMLSPSSRYLSSSKPLADFLATGGQNSRTDPLPSVYDRADVPEYSTYATVLSSGIKTFPVPERLSRKEAIGVVDLVKGWRGTREGTSLRVTRAGIQVLTADYAKRSRRRRFIPGAARRDRRQPSVVHAGFDEECSGLV